MTHKSVTEGGVTHEGLRRDCESCTNPQPAWRIRDDWQAHKLDGHTDDEARQAAANNAAHVDAMLAELDALAAKCSCIPLYDADCEIHGGDSTAKRKAQNMDVLEMTEEIAMLDQEWPLGRMLDLPSESRVLFAGMYKGRAAELLHALYQPRYVYGFDPQLWALRESETRAQDIGASYTIEYADGRNAGDQEYPEIWQRHHEARKLWPVEKQDAPFWSLFNFAIGTEGDHGKTLPMGEWETDGCSFLADTRTQGSGTIYEIGQVLNAVVLPAGGDTVPLLDLGLFNMEGYEYPLLMHMYEHGQLSWFDRLVVQFHTHAEGGYSMDTIRENMEKAGFELAFDDFPRWIYWRRR
jgi:hypothetical protein